MELTYTQVGDYLIPNIAVPDTPHHTLGKYGRMRRSYLKERRPIVWNQMVLDGTIWQHLADVDRICYERMDTLTVFNHQHIVLRLFGAALMYPDICTGRR